jgi:hypothetical protein
LPAASRWTERGAQPNAPTQHRSRIDAEHHGRRRHLERLKWAGEDAEQAERTAAIGEP